MICVNHDLILNCIHSTNVAAVYFMLKKQIIAYIFLLILITFYDYAYSQLKSVYTQEGSVASQLVFAYTFDNTALFKSIIPKETIRGRVIKRGTRKPLSNITVTINGISIDQDTCIPVPSSQYLSYLGTLPGQYISENFLVTETDSLGEFSFWGVRGETCTLSINQESFRPFKKNISPHPDSIITVKCYILQISKSDYEIIVYGEKEAHEVTKQTIDAKDAKSIPGAGEDILRSMQAMPSISQPQYDNDEALIIRGAPKMSSGFYYEGIKIPRLFHNSCGLPMLTRSTILSDAIKSIDFFPSGAGVEYGGVTGGIVDINGKTAKTDRVHGSVNVGALDVSAFLDIPNRKKSFSILGGFRRSVLSDIIHYLDGVNKNTYNYALVPYYWDYFTRLNFTGIKNHTMFLSMLGAYDGYELIAPKRSTMQIEELQFSCDSSFDHYQTAIYGWLWKISNNTSNDLRLALSWKKHKYGYLSCHELINDFEIISLNLKCDHKLIYENNDITVQFKNTLKHQVKENVKFVLGADFEYTKMYSHKLDYYQYKNSYGDTLISSQPLPYLKPHTDDIINSNRYDTTSTGRFGVFCEITANIAKKLYLTTGIRYDYYSHLHHDGTIVPEMWDYSFFNNDRGPSADPCLRIASTYHINKNHLIKAFAGNFNMSPYMPSRRHQPSASSTKTPVIKGAQYVLGYEFKKNDLFTCDIQGYRHDWWDRSDLGIGNYTDFKSYGLEILTKFNRNNSLSGWIVYALSQNKYQSVDKNWIVSWNNHLHDLQIFGNISIRNNWQIGLRTRFVSGYRYTPIVDAWYDADNSQYVGIFGESNSATMDPVFMVDFRIFKIFMLKNWVLEINLDIQNALIWLYKSPMSFDDDLKSPRPYYLYNVKTGKEDFETFDGYCVPYLSFTAKF